MSNAKQITLTIDGKPVTVAQGTTVLQACEQAHSPVPFYCYHPGLSIAGNCRICLVEIEGTPKLQISCYMPAAEGMAVKTATDKALAGRKAVLEFLLANHPLDCPVCDQAGECWLQDYYMEYGLYDPKFNEQKIKKGKAVPVGPKVMLDAERCILCSRCVRFCDEITKTSEFGIFNRGDHSEIGVAPGTQVDNDYSGCTVDICPVGALTDRDFRFKCRVWYLGTTPSVCPGCSMGCNIDIHDNREREQRPHIAKGERVMRLKPRHNPDVNQWWMCDEGRYAYHAIDQNRLTQVQRNERGALRAADRAGTILAGEEVPRAAGRAATWDEALALIVETLQPLQQAQRMDRVGVLLSTQLTNEDLYVAKRWCAALDIRRVVVQDAVMGRSDALLIKADKSPNTRGAQALGFSFDGAALLQQAAHGELDVLYVFGHDLVTRHGLALVQQASEHLRLFILQGSHSNLTVPLAHLALPSAVYAEKDGTLTNVQGRVQRIRPAFPPLGDAKGDWQILVELGARLGATLPFADSQAIFKELAAHEPAFTGLSYETIGDQGALLNGEGSRVKGEGHT